MIRNNSWLTLDSFCCIHEPPYKGGLAVALLSVSCKAGPASEFGVSVSTNTTVLQTTSDQSCLCCRRP